MASPVSDYYACPSGRILSAGRYITPSWAPAAGECKTISYAQGAHPLGLAAVLEEIDPIYMDWNPDAPGHGPYGPSGYYFSGCLAYSGVSFNSDTRQIVMYGTGHAAVNVCAPYCFDLNDLAFKWLDSPLPFDGMYGIMTAGYSVPPSQANVELVYPPAQYNYTWGDIDGDWGGWDSGYSRPGKIQPVPGHSRAGLAHIPASIAGNASGKMLYCVSPTGYLSGINAKASHSFNYDGDGSGYPIGWNRHSNQIGASASTGSNGRGTVVDVDSAKAIVFGKGSTASADYWVMDVATETWSTRTATSSVSLATDTGGNLIHTDSRLMICPASRTSGDAVPSGSGASFTGVKYVFYATPIDDIVGSGSFAPTALTVSVDSTWPLNNYSNNEFIGWSYCPADGCLYAVNGVNGSTGYWRLAPPSGSTTSGQYLAGTWTLTAHTFATGALSSPTTRSFVYNRLTWDARSRSFIWFGDSYLGPVMAFRPEGL